MSVSVDADTDKRQMCSEDTTGVYHMKYEQIKYQKSLALLESIFANVPEDCEELRIGLRVYFASTSAKPMYFITDYLYYGEGRTRVRFADRDDQLQVWPQQFTDIIAAKGWTQNQPTRRNTTEFLYTFIPQPNDKYPGYKLRSKSVQYTERRHQDRVFAAMAGETV